jgi:hypothetical protein
MALNLIWAATLVALVGSVLVARQAVLLMRGIGSVSVRLGALTPQVATVSLKSSAEHFQSAFPSPSLLGAFSLFGFALMGLLMSSSGLQAQGFGGGGGIW